MAQQQDGFTAHLSELIEHLRRHPVRTMWIGVAVQAVALGAAGWAVWHETRRETAAAEATKYLWRLGWHDALHHMPWVALMLGCLLLYIVGALLFAMRFAPHHAGRALGILIALLAGLAVFGVVMLFVAAIAAGLSAIGVDLPDDLLDGVAASLPDWRFRDRSKPGG